MSIQSFSKDWPFRVDDIPNVGQRPRPLHHHLRHLHPGVLTGNIRNALTNREENVEDRHTCIQTKAAKFHTSLVMHHAISLPGILCAFPDPGWRWPEGTGQPNEIPDGKYYELVHHVARHLRQHMGSHCAKHRPPLYRPSKRIESKTVLHRTC